jgi:hypothetical protein
MTDVVVLTEDYSSVRSTNTYFYNRMQRQLFVLQTIIDYP